MNNNSIDKNHTGKKNTLKVLGPLVLGIGIIFLVICLVDFFRSFNSMGSMNSFGFNNTPDAPTKFWCGFIGIPLIGFGGAMCKFAFMGEVARYSAGEISPVAKDTINYMASGTKDSIREVTKAVKEGLTSNTDEGSNEKYIICSECQTKNDYDAKYCKNCSAKLNKYKVCWYCNEKNDYDAKFCNNCGNSLKER
ncbi:zinc ribbon domain-containing protein [Vallitalea guaymasensis]|uniref:zinc ribbon domain-containing protein n=1 Tax=Vallitalea guaymasensis TaxID=1185412 RepID=UPI002356BFC0|nr:zinc ribbon domain-containing protein [Vallitalea guaymasensis]